LPHPPPEHSLPVIRHATPPAEPGAPTPAPAGTLAALPPLAEAHGGLLLTLAYVALTLVGMTYEWWLFLFFKINILTYAETSDFLLAAVRSPLVILLCLLPLMLVWVLVRADQWARRRWRGWAAYQAFYDRTIYRDPRRKVAMWVVFVVMYALVFTQLYAKREAQAIKRGRGTEVRVQFTSEAAGALGEAPLDALLLGTTGRYLFLYFPAERRTDVVPVDNVARLLVRADRWRQRPAPAAYRPPPESAGR